MLLIATDEAGYGPKLGPLIVAATAWQIPDKAASTQQGLLNAFAPMRQPLACGNAKVVIDDSKAVYKPKEGSADALGSLHAAVSAAARWMQSDSSDSNQWIREVAPDDDEQIRSTAWLRNISDQAFLPSVDTERAIASWSDTGVRLLDVSVRIITASAFNDFCNERVNKADLLSETTLMLVRRLFEKWVQSDKPTAAFCDRHGGRRYYGSVLQHVFPDAPVNVLSESKSQSVYRLTHNNSPVTIHFTVKGDSFTPVAMSSMIAKYVRERLMQSFNHYFASLHQGPEPLRPTAGYPTDADRFLQDIASIIDSQQIQLHDFVRTR